MWKPWHQWEHFSLLFSISESKIYVWNGLYDNDIKENNKKHKIYIKLENKQNISQQLSDFYIENHVKIVVSSG